MAEVRASVEDNGITTAIGIDPSLRATGVVALNIHDTGRLELLYRKTVRTVAGEHTAFTDRVSRMHMDSHEAIFRAWTACLNGNDTDLPFIVMEDPTGFVQFPGIKRKLVDSARMGAGFAAVYLSARQLADEWSQPLHIYTVRLWLPRAKGRNKKHKDYVAELKATHEELAYATDDEIMAAGLVLYHVNKGD